MKKVFLYSRVSTSLQNKGLEAQELSLENFCKKSNIEHYQLFSDVNVSGSKSSRPELNKMMAEVEKGNASKVIVYSFSRFARSTRHLLDALEFFKENNIEFISLSENIDTSTAIGTAFFTIISAIGQLERELISERVKNGLANAKSKGRIIGRPKKRPSETIIHLHKEGYSYRKISKIINFSHTAVAREIQNHKRNQISSNINMITKQGNS